MKDPPELLLKGLAENGGHLLLLKMATYYF